jgi:hypothetical protein
MPFLHSVRDTVVRKQTRNNVERGTSKGQMFRKRQQTHQEGSNGIRDRDFGAATSWK